MEFKELIEELTKLKKTFTDLSNTEILKLYELKILLDIKTALK